MKEHPILFSAPMVRAILAGTKTQTRRVVKLRPTNGWAPESPPVLGRITSPHPKRGRFGVFVRRGLGTDFPETDLIPCPYGMPGDRLWVRETWAHGIHALAAMRDEDGPFVYAATDREDQRLGDRWRPSIHMPRWASRILLEIVSVRVERLQDISAADAIAEGIERIGGSTSCTPWRKYGLPTDSPHAMHCASPVASYASLWESISGPGSWDANPLVWVVEFKVLTP